MFKQFTTACLAVIASCATAADWNYNQLGDDWYKAYPLCGTGTQQSPIDIGSWDTQLSNVTMTLGTYQNMPASQVKVVDKGYTLQANFPEPVGTAGSFKRTFFGQPGDVTFNSAQVHIHVPSEHTVNGYHFDAEVHIVHLMANGTLGGVLGVFFDREKGGREENAFLGQLLTPTATAEGSARDINLGDFVAGLDQNKFFSYPGSLTTPPCTEGIRWNVFMDVQGLSDAQYEKFVAYWGAHQEFFSHGNYRRPQPLKGRIVQASQQPVGWSQLVTYTGARILTGAAASVAALAMTHF